MNDQFIHWIKNNRKELGPLKKFLEEIREEVKEEIFIGEGSRDRDMKIKGKVEMLDNIICNL